ncbi:MAG: hypothetical protein JW969_09210 [Spirochaetales bacterium]|nr:hypothetical protein [Spirochaetales bacterium]
MRTVKSCLVLLILLANTVLSAGDLTIGNVRITAPEGWKAQQQGPVYAWTASKKTKLDSLLQWEYVSPLNGTLKDAFDWKLKQEESNYVVHKKDKINSLDLSPPFKAYFTQWVISNKGGKAKFIYFGTLIEALGNVYFLKLITGSNEALKSILSTEYKAMLESLSIIRPVLQPKKLQGKLKAISPFGFKIMVPADWTVKNKDNYYSYDIFIEKVISGSVKFKFPVYMVLQTGSFTEREIALKHWIENILYAHVFEKRPHTYNPFYALSWKTGANEEGATYKTTHFNEYNRFQAHICGHILNRNNATFLIASPFTYEGIKLELHDKASRVYDALVDELRNIIMNAGFQLPKKNLPDWENYLVKRKQYRYERHLDLFYDVTTFSSTTKIIWNFYNDKTCEMKKTSDTYTFSDFSDDYYNPNNVPITVTGWLDKDNKIDRSRFEVREAGKSLWLHVIDSIGMGTFFKLEPEKTEKYGTFQPRGLAIDDNIEGKYSEGNNYQVYEAL